MSLLARLLPGQPVTSPPRRDQQRSLFSFGGQTYNGIPIQTTWGKTPAETIPSDFEGMVSKALQASAVVAAVEGVRTSVFSEARFQWQRFNNGRPGDLFGNADLALLERPWPGGTTGDLLTRMLLHADFGGNSYVARVQGELVPMRPDWVDIILAPRDVDLGNETATIGYKRVGYAYWHDGQRFGNARPVVFLPDEVCHFAPLPDPCANYRGMSIYTPVLREIEADKQATVHKSAFFENAATPNLAVTLPKEIDAKDFDEFVESMDRAHKGAENAYKTLYLAGGADPTVIGQNFQQLDFKAVQGAGETRIAAAAGVGAILANLSEGMQGSSLNAGNYQAAKRRFADATMRPLWRNAAGSLETILVAPPGEGARLWYDDRDVAFLRDDQRDVAEIASKEAYTIRNLIDAGFEADSVKRAVTANDWSLLIHSGLFSVQLQKPGAAEPTTPAQEGQ